MRFKIGFQFYGSDSNTAPAYANHAGNIIIFSAKTDILFSTCVNKVFVVVYRTKTDAFDCVADEGPQCKMSSSPLLYSLL